jgi:imidazolonepropionase-like amidohydrolase
VLTARRLWDGRTSELFHDYAMEIQDGRILDIGPRSDNVPESVSESRDLVDLGDATLMPGLIDAHQHLVFDASDDPVAHLEAEDDTDLLLQMQLAAQRALAVGITTICDLGDATTCRGR